MNKFFKRLALLLAVLMIVSMMPVQLFADNSVAGEEQSNGTGEASGNSNAVAKIGDTGYESLADAIANATPDANGTIIYEIYGKATVDSTGWVQVARAGLTGLTKVEFVGKTSDAEICIVENAGLLADQSYDIDVSFANLILSKKAPGWVGDMGHAANYFTCWLRNTNAAENTVTYTNCTFPNGLCNNQYGKTVVDGCTFSNTTTGMYNFWNYGGNTEIKNSTFTGVRGIKTYNEGTLAVAPTVKIENTTFDSLTEKAAIVASKATDITLDNVSATDCGKGFFQKDIESSGETTTIEANGSDISGNFNITAEKGAAAAKEEFNISAGTFTSEVSSDYLADDFELKDNGDGTYGVAAKNYVAAIGDAYYSTLQEAIDAARRNSTVKLLADTRENVTIDKQLTLDLNGFTLNGSTGERKPALTVTVRGVTVKDSSEAQTGTIMRDDTPENSGVSSHYVIDIQGNGWLTFESGIVKNNSGSAAGKGASLVRVGDDSVAKQPGLVINGGSFTQDNFIVIKVDRGYLTLNGGTLTSANSYAIENWFRATIKGGTVNGTAAAWTYSGGFNSTLTVEGGTINGNVLSVNYGSAEGKVAKVEITGGTVNGELGTYTYSNGLTATEDATKATIGITGGTFSSDPTKYLVEGSTVTPNSDGTFGVEKLTKAYLAEVDGNKYYTMDEAFHAAVAAGSTLKLLRNYTTASSQNSGSKSFTIDLNGFTWTYTGTNVNDAAFEINHPNATLTVKNGKVVSASMAGLIPSAMSGTITYDNSGLVFDGVEITANGHSGIETNGNNTNDTVTLKNSTLNVPNGFGIYFPSSGTLTVENSKITAKTMGVQVCAGSLSINEGSAVTVTGDAVEKTENDGAIQDGAAISIVNRTGYKGLGTVTISGGKFTAKEGNSAIKAYNWATNTESAFTASDKVAVSGGTFSSEVSEDLCAEGFIPTKNADDTYGVKAGKYVAQIGSTKYETLDAAIAAANAGDTIALIADVTVSATITVAGKELVLDLNGKSISGDVDPAISVSAGAKLTIKDSVGNGTITTSKFNASCIINAGVLNIEGGNFSAYYGAVKALGGSTTTIDGGEFSDTGKRVGGGYGLYFYANGTALTVSINGGEFKNNVDKSGIDANVTLKVNGGTFTNDLSDYCPEGFGTVLENGKYVYSRTAAPAGYVEDENGNVTISDEEGLFWFAKQVNSGNTFKGKTVKLANDITLTKTWTPVGVSVQNSFQGTFDGNGHSIVGMDVDGAYQEYGLGFFKLVISATIKNVTFKNANVTGIYSNVVGIVSGYSYGSSTFENVHVVDSTVYAFGKVGGMVGMAADGGATTTFKNCSVSDTTIHGGYNVAGFLGLVIMGKCNISGSYLANNNIIIDENSQGFGEVTWLDTTVACDGSVGTCAGNGTVIKGRYIPNGDYYYSAYSDLYNHYGASSHDCTLTNGKYLANSEVVHDAPVKIGDVLYSDLQAAVDAVKSDEIITLLDDVDLGTDELSTFDVKSTVKNVTIDLSGHTLTSAYKYTIYLKVNDWTIQNGTIKNTNASTTYGTLYIGGSYNSTTLKNVTIESKTNGVYFAIASNKNGIKTSITVEDGTKISGNYGVYMKGQPKPWGKTRDGQEILNVNGGEITGKIAAIAVFGAAKGNTKAGVIVNINGGKVYSEGYAIAGNGSSLLENTTININGGSVISTKDTAIYHPQAGTVNVTGGTVSGVTGGIQMCAGTLNVTGGTITATGNGDVSGKTGDGSIPDGAAVSIVNRGYPAGAPTAAISGGVLTSAKNVDAVQAYEWSSDAKAEWSNPNASVSGGTFSSAVPEEYCAEGFIPTKNADGTYGVKAGKYVAQIGNVKYETLADAIAAAKDGGTVKLLDDVDLTETLIIRDKTITLDLNGKTISNSTDIWDESTYSWSLISVRDNGDLTIDDTVGGGTLKAKENDCFTLDVYAYDTKNVENTRLTVNAGNYIGNISAVYAFTGKVTINGGHFSIQQKESGSDPYRLTLNCYDSSYTAGRAGFTVNGGTFENFDPRNNLAEGAGTSFVAEGVGINKDENGNFTAVPNMAAQIVDADGNSVAAYADHYDAIAAAKDGETVILLSDRKNFVTNTINANITIDLNGKTLSVGNNVSEMFKANGEVTIQNGTITSNMACAIVNAYNKLTLKNVKITGVTGNNGRNLVNVYSNAEVTIDKDTVLTASGSNGAAVFIGQDADAKYTLNVYGKVIRESKSFAISGNGSYKGTTTINIYDGAEVKSASVAIYHPQAGVINVNGGLVEGYCAIGIKSGTLNINGGTVRGTADDHVLDDSNSTSGTIIYDGSAIVVDSRATGYAGNVNINVTGGTVESYYSTAIREIGEQGKTDMTQLTKLNVIGGSVLGASKNPVNVTSDMLVRDISVINISVSGGTFKHAIPDSYCADGFIPTKNADGTYGVKEGKYVAQIGNVKYETLAEAIAAANADDTVTILANVELTAMMTISGKTFTLDLNGFSIKSKLTAIELDGGTNMTVLDSSAAASGMINSDYTGIIVAAGTTLTVKSGTIFGDTKAVLNSGTVNIEGTANLKRNITYSVDCMSGSTLNMTGGTVFDIGTTESESTYNYTVNISGGKVENYVYATSVTGGEIKDLILIKGSEVKNATINGSIKWLDNTVPTLTNVTLGSNATVKNEGYRFNSDRTGIEEIPYVAEINGIKYETLEEAFAAAKNGDTITLLEDCKSDRINLEDKSVTVALNGKTLTSTAAYGVMFCAKNGNKITIDGNVEGSKLVGTLMITNGTDGHIEVNGGTYENSRYCPIYVNGAVNSEKSTVTVKNAIINATNSNSNQDMGCGVYLAGYSTSVFENCTITAPVTGIEIRAGKLTLNNCDVTGGNGKVTADANGNGTTVTNAALAISQHNTRKPIDVTIDGGTFNGTAAVYQTDVQGTGSVDVKIAVNDGTFNGEILGETDGAIAISGGKFKFKVDDKYFADKLACSATPNADGYYTVKDHPIISAGLTISADMSFRVKVRSGYKNGSLRYYYDTIGENNTIVRVEGEGILGATDAEGNSIFRIYNVNPQRADLVYTFQYYDAEGNAVGTPKQRSVLAYFEDFYNLPLGDKEDLDAKKTFIANFLEYCASAMERSHDLHKDVTLNGKTWQDRADAVREMMTRLGLEATDYEFKGNLGRYFKDNSEGIILKRGVVFGSTFKAYYQISKEAIDDNGYRVFRQGMDVTDKLELVDGAYRLYFELAPYEFKDNLTITVNNGTTKVCEYTSPLANTLEVLSKSTDASLAKMAKAAFNYFVALQNYNG